MAELTAGDAKLVQYLNEAYGTEKRLETSLEAHIAMTAKASYKKRLREHLTETKRHAREVQRRIKQLGGTAETISLPGPDRVEEAAQAVLGGAQKAVALAPATYRVVRSVKAGAGQPLIVSPKGDPSESLQIDQISPGWTTLPPSGLHPGQGGGEVVDLEVGQRERVAGTTPARVQRRSPGRERRFASLRRPCAARGLRSSNSVQKRSARSGSSAGNSIRASGEAMLEHVTRPPVHGLARLPRRRYCPAAIIATPATASSDPRRMPEPHALSEDRSRRARS